ncbi:MAG TPA: hypothetical protein VG457_16965 [Planctomycetota bacterium]|jgi:hypothetical protein|nr:hypothetical protein [Planctomycetota bacterium]
MRLCESGVATMAELLDWDGVWSEPLIRLAEATLGELEADEMERHQMAVTAGIAGAFQKNGAKGFQDVMAKVKKASREARGGKAVDPEQGKESAQTMMQIFGQMGLSTRKGRKR